MKLGSIVEMTSGLGECRDVEAERFDGCHVHHWPSCRVRQTLHYLPYHDLDSCFRSLGLDEVVKTSLDYAASSDHLVKSLLVFFASLISGRWICVLHLIDLMKALRASERMLAGPKNIGCVVEGDKMDCVLCLLWDYGQGRKAFLKV